MAQDPVTVVGGTSTVGRWLLNKLQAKGGKVQALTRKLQHDPGTDKLSWHRLQTPLNEFLQPSTILFYLAPIWTLTEYLPGLPELGIKRIIVFSSTSRFTKQMSNDDSEQNTVHRLVSSEQQIIEFCHQHNIAWTILRPTLIYGDMCTDDPTAMGKALAAIVKMIKMFHFFPLVGKGQGLRQPVHAEDLAEACLAVMSNEHTYNKCYNLSGGEQLTYQQMIAKIFNVLDMKPWFLSVPLWVIRGMLLILKIFPQYRFLTPEMANRMNQDMVFDHVAAQQDFGYQPRVFLAAKNS